jgi:hypothetical protein
MLKKKIEESQKKENMLRKKLEESQPREIYLELRKNLKF